MARGMEHNLRPAVTQLREAIFFGERQHTTLWILVALVGVLVVGVILLARNVRLQHTTQRALMDALHQRHKTRQRSERRRSLRRRLAT